MMKRSGHFTFKAIVVAGLFVGGTAHAADAPSDDTADLCSGSIAAADLDNASRDAKGPSEEEVLLGVARAKFAKAHQGMRRKKEFEDLVRELAEQIGRRDLAREDVAQKLTAGVAMACKGLEAGEASETATRTAFAASGLPDPEVHSDVDEAPSSDSQYVFFIGSVNSLEANGGWNSALEASLVSVTRFFGEPLPDADDRKYQASDKRSLLEQLRLSTSQTRLFGRFEMTFSEIGKIEDETTPDAPAQGEAPEAPADQAEAPAENPFAVGGGILRVNLGPEILIGEDGWFGVTSGVGFTTHPSDADLADVDARRRWYAGMLMLANYGSSEKNKGRVTGRLALGYSDDKFWEWTETTEVEGVSTSRQRDESGRWFLDARIDGPNVFKSESVKLSARLFVDHPTTGRGPTDVRISLLVTADLGSLAGK
jgi:hypothetical protein